MKITISAKNTTVDRLAYEFLDKEDLKKFRNGLILNATTPFSIKSNVYTVTNLSDGEYLDFDIDIDEAWILKVSLKMVRFYMNVSNAFKGMFVGIASMVKSTFSSFHTGFEGMMENVTSEMGETKTYDKDGNEIHFVNNIVMDNEMYEAFKKSDADPEDFVIEWNKKLQKDDNENSDKESENVKSEQTGEFNI